MSVLRGKLGQYRLVREIGRGGMAVVFLAEQRALDRQVALKELPVTTGSPELLERFSREAQIAASLSHPNVVPVHDYFEHDGVPCLVMDHLPRGSLRPLMGRLAGVELFGVLDGVLRGLAYAHERGVVHRDIKPENILVTAEGGVQIADFGIAKLYTGTAHGIETHAGAALGTPAYMAPEQVENRAVGPATDLYAVGVMAYEALAGTTPFASPEATPLQLMVRHVLEPAPPLEERVPGVDPRLAAWVGRLLVKDPSERPASAIAVRDELEEIAVANHGPVWRRAASLSPRAPAPAQKPPATTGRRRRMLLAAGALAAAATLGWLVIRDADAPIVTVADTVTVGAAGTTLRFLAVGRDDVWVTNPADDTVGRIDPEAGRQVETVPVGPQAADVGVGERVWVVSGEDGSLTHFTPPSRRPERLAVGRSPAAVAVDRAEAWVTLFDTDRVRAIAGDPPHLVGQPIPVGDQPNGIAAGADAVWVANFGDGTVSRIDRATRRVTDAAIATGGGPTDVIVAEGAVWVANSRDRSVARIDPDTRRVAARIDVGPGPLCLAASAGRIWVTVADTLVMIDPADNTSKPAELDLGAKDNCVEAGAAGLWASVRDHDEVLRLEPRP